LSEKGLVPTNVIYLGNSVKETYKRTANSTTFGANRIILEERLATMSKNIPHILQFYNNLYQNAVRIDGHRSKWFVYDQSFKAIQAVMASRQAWVRDYSLPQQLCKT
jgi:hypothetical protein